MSANIQPVQRLRPAHIIAKVVRVENVFDDPDELLDTVNARAPLSLIYGKKGYERSGGAEPWFRDHWVTDGVVAVPEAEHFLHNAKLVEGAKEAFGTTVVRPHGMIWNVLGPMIAGRPHFDTSPYRGIKDVPFWLHVAFTIRSFSIPGRCLRPRGWCCSIAASGAASNIGRTVPTGRRSRSCRRSGISVW